MDAVLALPAIHAVHELDDVAVPLRDLSAGEDLGPVTACADIPKGHKVSLKAVPVGAEVRKYGWPIGRATQAVAAGDHVHSHNLETLLSGLEGYAFDRAQAPPTRAALAAAGASVILFTTGRGTPLGFPAPTLKIACNSGLAAGKSRWIDFDAGIVLAGASIDEGTERLLDLVIEAASGAPTKAEPNGEREIAIWKRVVTL